MTRTVKIDLSFEQAARARQLRLTKPPGALGRLEDVACWLAARQRTEIPVALTPAIAVFAGDHGVTEEGVSAFPSIVTAEMVRNFARGGAAINVLARFIGARLSVVDVGVLTPLDEVENIVHAKVRAGTANLATMAAMTRAEAEAALAAGRAQAQSDADAGSNLLIAGDMGIGNTTVSTCLVCALTGADPEAVVGIGTGVDAQGRRRKVEVVRRTLARVAREKPSDGVGWLAEMGGLEIGAIAGYYLRAAELGVPALVDGFIATAGALVARAIEPSVIDWLLASHRSFEMGHRIALESLKLTPLLDLGMRLGEGSGAALTLPLLQGAIRLHAEMATFAEAGVSEKSDPKSGG